MKLGLCCRTGLTVRIIGSFKQRGAGEGFLLGEIDNRKIKKKNN
jgi:hypothetical protein